MSMTDWAKREVEIACARERAASGVKEGDWDYGSACYESALKAFRSLAEDGHSGMSIVFTKQILNRLIDGKPLTPIEDTDDIWNDISDISGHRGEVVNYQCKRMSSLFKYIYVDGTVKYSDNNSHYCIDINDPNNTYHSGLVRGIIEEIFPITMPYYPGEPIKVFCEEFLVDPKNGDFDTVGIFNAVEPGGKETYINRFFKEGDDDWEEINEAEYAERKAAALMRKKQEVINHGQS